jgi:hypothetical protein
MAVNRHVGFKKSKDRKCLVLKVTSKHFSASVCQSSGKSVNQIANYGIVLNMVFGRHVGFSTKQILK